MAAGGLPYRAQSNRDHCRGMRRQSTAIRHFLARFEVPTRRGRPWGYWGSAPALEPLRPQQRQRSRSRIEQDDAAAIYKLRDWLYTEYAVNRRSSSEMGAECGVTRTVIIYYLKRSGSRAATAGSQARRTQPGMEGWRIPVAIFTGLEVAGPQDPRPRQVDLPGLWRVSPKVGHSPARPSHRRQQAEQRSGEPDLPLRQVPPQAHAAGNLGKSRRTLPDGTRTARIP